MSVNLFHKNFSGFFPSVIVDEAVLQANYPLMNPRNVDHSLYHQMKVFWLAKSMNWSINLSWSSPVSSFFTEDGHEAISYSSGTMIGSGTSTYDTPPQQRVTGNGGGVFGEIDYTIATTFFANQYWSPPSGYSYTNSVLASELEPDQDGHVIVSWMRSFNPDSPGYGTYGGYGNDIYVSKDSSVSPAKFRSSLLGYFPLNGEDELSGSARAFTTFGRQADGSLLPGIWTTGATLNLRIAGVDLPTLIPLNYLLDEEGYTGDGYTCTGQVVFDFEDFFS